MYVGLFSGEIVSSYLYLGFRLLAVSVDEMLSKSHGSQKDELLHNFGSSVICLGINKFSARGNS